MQINVLYLITLMQKSYKIQYDHYAGLIYNIAHNGPTQTHMLQHAQALVSILEFGWEFLLMLLILKQSYAAD